MATCASARVSGPPAKIGDPLPGLTPAELARFQAGKAVFQRTFDAAHGLGPLFNSTSCAECHEQPVVGGVGKGRSVVMTPKSMRASSRTISATS